VDIAHCWTIGSAGDFGNSVAGGMQGDAFMDIGEIQCPRPNTCVALGVSDQGSRSAPAYTTNP
jgi:hypothetical protein